MSAILVKMPPAMRSADAPSDSPMAKPMKQEPARSRGMNSRMHSMMNSSTLMSSMPMLMPASSGIACSGNGLARRLANAMRELANVLTRMPNHLSAIGIAGMDRLVRFNVLAMSGRAVEAAGDVDTLLLDKTGTITLGNRQATEFLPVAGVDERDLADAAQLASLSDETPEGRSIVVLAKEKYDIRGREMAPLHAKFIPFSAYTRISGIDVDGTSIRKGAVDAVIADVKADADRARRRARDRDRSPTRSPSRAARRSRSPRTASCWA